MRPTVPLPFQVMAKPSGAACNLACRYCYYLDKEQLYPERPHRRMSRRVLEIFVRDYIAAQAATPGPEIWFNWQGGEPTLRGVDFFEEVVRLQAQYRPAHKTVRNTLQTNGTLLDDAWGAFLAANDVLVGISIDGPVEHHDGHRVDRQNRPSLARVLAGLEVLQRHGVAYNVLTVVHRDNVTAPLEVYRYLKALGATFIQFIPLVERETAAGRLAGPPQTDPPGPHQRIAPWSVPPAAYGDFLCAIFDAWVAEDIGRVFVQFFEVQLGIWAGLPASLCIYAETCGRGLALECNGDLYACDHYVYPDHRRGNIQATPLAALAGGGEQAAFGARKASDLPAQCRRCAFRPACNGGCPKHRFLESADGEWTLNYFCAGHLRFFRHAAPTLHRLTAPWRDGARAPGL